MDKISFNDIQTSYIAQPILFLTACLFYPILFFLYLLFVITKITVHLWLKHKHGSAYAGMASGGDAFWNFDENLRKIVNSVMTIECKTDSIKNFPSEIRSDFIQKFSCSIKDHPKLAYVVRQCMGYSYYLRNLVDIKEFISIVDINNRETITQDFFEDILVSHTHKPLPQDDMGLFEIIIFNKPLVEVGSKCKFPVLLRFNHIVGDGLSLSTVISNIIGNFGTSGVVDFLKRRYNIINQDKNTKNMSRKLKNSFKLIHLLITFPAISFYQVFLRKSDENIVHRKSYPTERVLAYNVEEKSRLVNVVKQIKKVLPGVSFTDIILAAVSSSIYFHFLKVCIQFSDIFKFYMKLII